VYHIHTAGCCIGFMVRSGHQHARCEEVRICIIEKILSEKGRPLRHPVTELVAMFTMKIFIRFVSRTITKIKFLPRPVVGYTASSNINSVKSVTGLFDVRSPT
jgi:hypothetical protein